MDDETYVDEQGFLRSEVGERQMYVHGVWVSSGGDKIWAAFKDMPRRWMPPRLRTDFKGDEGLTGPDAPQ